jgi:NADPH-dependent curcumin reductase CurA
MKAKVITLKSRPEGLPRLSNFETIEEAVPPIQEGELLLEAVYISVDPFIRVRMAGNKHPRFELGQPLASRVIARVVQSRHKDFLQEEFVIHYLPWKTLQVSNGTGVTKLIASAAPLTAYLGVLGITGLTAYFALRDIGKPKAGETLVVSGAAGAVGSIAGQIGKLLGCRVVGIVGTDEKAALTSTKFGFDATINYKTASDIEAAIAAACPDGVDIYFDTVGGRISNGVLANSNAHGRVIVCGAIANYNGQAPVAAPGLLTTVLDKFLTIQGFGIVDYVFQFQEGVAQLAAWLSEGKIKYTETIVDGFDRLPEALIDLFEGRSEGKMIVKV